MVNKENLLMEREIVDLCQQHQVIILKKDHHTITIACSKSPNEDFIAALRFVSGLIVNINIWPQAKIESMMEQGSLQTSKEIYCAESNDMQPYHIEKQNTNYLNHHTIETNNIRDEDIDTPVIQLINQAILTAIQKKSLRHSL